MYPLNIGVVVSNSGLWTEAQAELAKLSSTVVFEQASIGDPVSFIEKVDRLRPDVILLDPTGLDVNLAELIARLRAAASAPHVVIIRETADPQVILAAIRAGASEYVYPPLATQLPVALERIAQAREQENTRSDRKGGKVLAFLSVKGGCGATTLACHTAVELVELTGKTALLADLDFAAGIIRVLMQAKSRYSIMDAMNNVQRLDPSYWHGLVSNGYQGLEIIASGTLEATRRLPHHHEIRHVLRFVRGLYDWVVVDLGHGLEPQTLSSLEGIDTLCLVSTLELPALQQTKLLLRQIRESGFDPDRTRLIMNRVHRQTEIGPDEVEKVLGVPIFASIPNDYRALERAYSEGGLLPEGHHLRVTIRRVAARLANIEVDVKKKKFTLFGL